MFETHDGLSKDYEVSFKQLDFLVDNVSHSDNVLGARMMGGGFGGCNINTVKKEAVEELVKTTSNHYFKEFNLKLTTFVANIEKGTSIIF